MDNTKIIVKDDKPDKVKDIVPPTYNEVKKTLKYKPRQQLVDFIFHQCTEMTGTPMFVKGQRDELLKMSKGQLARTIINLSVEKQKRLNDIKKSRWYDWIPFVKPARLLFAKWIKWRRSIFVKKFYSINRKVNN